MADSVVRTGKGGKPAKGGPNPGRPGRGGNTNRPKPGKPPKPFTPKPPPTPKPPKPEPTPVGPPQPQPSPLPGRDEPPTPGSKVPEDGQPEVLACESVLGPPQEGFRWEGSYVKNPDGSVSSSCRLVAIEEEPEDTSQRDAERRRAKDMFRSVLNGMGFTTDFGFTQAEINQLYASIEGWVSDGWADGPGGGEQMLMLFRTSDTTKSIYEKRFPGMKALASRGQAINEAEYIRLESSYRDVLSSYNLPRQYYDSFDDYGRFIAGGVSAAEVEGRVIAARAAMNPLIARELQDYYGIGQDKALAFLLGMTDEKGLMLDAQAEARSQQTIRDISRNVQIGGLAEGAGFRMGVTESAALAGTTLGQTIDPFDVRTGAQLEGTFAQARRTANRESVLAGIDQEKYTEQDTLLAAFGDDKKRLASERRAKRERDRFAGSSGASSASLGVQRNF